MRKSLSIVMGCILLCMSPAFSVHATEMIAKELIATTESPSASAIVTPSPSTEILPEEVALTVDIVDTSNHTYTYSEMTEDIVALYNRYPEYMTFSSVGKSVDNRDIWQMIIGNPNAPHAIYVQSTIHGREWMNTWIVMKQAEELLKNYNTTVLNNVTYAHVFQKCAIYILPMTNPDGVTISQYGINGIVNPTLRANLSKMSGASTPSRWKANANGVDLNRNFSVGWGTTVNVTAPSGSFYNGTAPNTEPETLAIINAVNQREFTIAVSYHSMENAIYWNVGQTGELYDRSYTLAKQVKDITGYKLGNRSEPHGLAYNWFIHAKQIPTALIETGSVSCPLPYSQWEPIWKANKDVLAKLVVYYI